jgi:hypothetical protein
MHILLFGCVIRKGAARLVETTQALWLSDDGGAAGKAESSPRSNSTLYSTL